eukprot:scaffold71985_cov54-Phaeocystis_antarctica.AAC.2
MPNPNPSLEWCIVVYRGVTLCLDEGLHARCVDPLAARELLELLVGRLDAVHAHHRLHRLGEHLVGVRVRARVRVSITVCTGSASTSQFTSSSCARAASLRVTLLRPRRSAW